MEEGASIYRNAASLNKSAEVIKNLQERFRNISLADQSFTFNTELPVALELSYLLDIAEAIRPHGNDDALLCWNTYARIIMRQKLGPREEEYVESFLA